MKNKSLKILIVIFAFITIIGLTVNLFGGINNRTDNKNNDVKEDQNSNGDSGNDGASDVCPHEDLDLNCHCDYCEFVMHSFMGDCCENCGEYIEHVCSDSNTDCLCDICCVEHHNQDGIVDGWCMNCNTFLGSTDDCNHKDNDCNSCD